MIGASFNLKPTQAFVRTELRALGVSFKSLSETGEFKVSIAGKDSYFATDLQDALDTGRAMATRNAPSCVPNFPKVNRFLVGLGSFNP